MKFYLNDFNITVGAASSPNIQICNVHSRVTLYIYNSRSSTSEKWTDCSSKYIVLKFQQKLSGHVKGNETTTTITREKKPRQFEENPKICIKNVKFYIPFNTAVTFGTTM